VSALGKVLARDHGDVRVLVVSTGCGLLGKAELKFLGSVLGGEAGG
jgi:hypothetical protein